MGVSERRSTMPAGASAFQQKKCRGLPVKAIAHLAPENLRRPELLQRFHKLEVSSAKKLRNTSAKCYYLLPVFCVGF